MPTALHPLAALARRLARRLGPGPDPGYAPLAPVHARLLLALGLAVPLGACGGGAGDGVTSAPPGTHVPAGTNAPAGTYRAVFVATGPDGRDTLAVVEGELAPPVAAEDMIPVALPAHSGRIRVTNSRWPLPYGLDASAFLLTYREPDGDRVLYATDFSTPRFCDVDSADADVRAVPIAPMWASEAREHPLSVFDGTEPYDSLGSFTVTRPTGDANGTRLDAAAAAGRANVYLYVETRWADGRERPVALAFRGVSDGSWWASALRPDPRAVPAEGVQHYESDAFGLNVDRPEAYLIALDEEVAPARRPATAASPGRPTPAPPAPSASPPPPATAAPAQPATYAAGQAVQISWGGTWYAGRILQADGARYRVHYDGWEERWDEWVTPDRLRPAAA